MFEVQIYDGISDGSPGWCTSQDGIPDKETAIAKMNEMAENAGKGTYATSEFRVIEVIAKITL